MWVLGNYCRSTRPYRVIENGAIYQFNLTFSAIVMAPVGAGSPTALKGADRLNKPALQVFIVILKEVDWD